MDNMVVNLEQCTIGNEGKVVLDAIDLQLFRGEFCYLTGRSGTGKSTLFKTLYGEYPLQSGKAKVVGFDLNQVSRDMIPDLRRKIGMVFQDFRLFANWSASRNLLFILEATGWKDKEKAVARVEEVLAEVRLSEDKDRLAYTLSGGEQQRLCIARSIINTPDLIIADEPTGNLDPESSDEVFELFSNINQTRGTAILFATHDTRLISKYSSRVIHCQGRRLQEK